MNDNTDLSSVHYNIVYFQTIEDNPPLIYFYKLIELKKETGEADFNVLINITFWQARILRRYERECDQIFHLTDIRLI